MSDRITIDYIENTITIRIQSVPLVSMSENEIWTWLTDYINITKSSKLHVESPGDIPPPITDNVESI